MAPDPHAHPSEARARTVEALVASDALRIPDELPIATIAQRLGESIRANQVVIVAGETGSGKSTQLPKLCLAAGRGVRGLIGHTQPRRIAARSIAERLSHECGTPLGEAIGYAVRFTDRVGAASVVKVMTDGILLAEIQRDRLLRRYDTLIIDEAHERSLNIDFLLGVLAQLLPRRRDLKVIITSATIDTERFATHFAPYAHGVDVITVEGRSYPVDVRYRPFGEEPDDARDQVAAICDAVDEIRGDGAGDVLVFLSGEREIHDTADALRGLKLPATEVVPLYARLSVAEQQRVFAPHTGRRIVLATNVAETSLTVPGIRYVIDAGTARISRYSARARLQRLPIEPISQASADQRAGRCGRIAPGVCIRLYSEASYLERDEFTEPEITRTNLSAVILAMTAARLGDIETFPFLDAPETAAIRDGYRVLSELGAIVERDGWRLTDIGRAMVRLPIDPRLAAIVIAGHRLGCAREATIIAAALSIQDPREYPAERRETANAAHRRYATEGSDLLAHLRLWDALRERQREISNNQFRKHCRAEFLNYLRVREWQDLVRQIRTAAHQAGLRTSGDAAAHPDAIHRAVLAGLLSRIGMRERDGRDYRGAHGRRFALRRSSAVGRPRWLVAAEMVETDRVWASECAPIRPEWAEAEGAHLVRRSHDEPRWDAVRGRAVITEHVSLFGLPVGTHTVGLATLDEGLAHELFVRHALVERDAPAPWVARQRFLRINDELVEHLADRARRRRDASAIDDATIAAFYLSRIPAHVTTTRAFDRWLTRDGAADTVVMTEEALGHVRTDDTEEFPTRWRVGDTDYEVTYRFEPGAPDDGATVHVPLTALPTLDAAACSWPVRGYRTDAVLAALRTLPKALRRDLQPLAETAHTIAARLVNDGRPFTDAIAHALASTTTATVTPADLDLGAIADHLRLNIAVVGDDGRLVEQSRDLSALQRRLAGRTRAAIAHAAPIDERAGITTWDLGTLPRSVEVRRGEVNTTGYPALLDDGDSVSLRVFTRADLQRRAMAGGVFRLLRLETTIGTSSISRSLSSTESRAIAAAGIGLEALVADAVDAIVGDLVATVDELPFDAAAFAELAAAARSQVRSRAPEVVAEAAAGLAHVPVIRARLAELVAPSVADAAADLGAQLERLVHPGFVRATGVERLASLERYLRAMVLRLETFRRDLGRDAERMAQVHSLERRYRSLVAARREARHVDAATDRAIVEAGWALEDLRVALFAQALVGRHGTSPTRLARILASLEAAVGAPSRPA